MSDTMADVTDNEEEAEAKVGKMSRSQLIAELAEQTELNRKQCGSVLNALGSIITERMRSQGNFQLHGICRLVQVKKPALPAREKKCFGKVMQLNEREATSKVKAYPAGRLVKSLKDDAKPAKPEPKKRARQERPKAKAKSARKRPAAADDAAKDAAEGEDGDEAAAPEPAADTLFKMIKPLQLGLNLQVGETYSFNSLKERCKGKAAKIAKLTRMTADPAFLERLDSAA